MASVLRRPMAISACIKQLPKTTQTTSRAFHSSPKTSPFKSNSPLTALVKTRNVFQQPLRRTYMQQGGQYAPSNTGSMAQKLLYGAAIVGGTIAATNFMFNRETREDGGMPPYERAYLNDTFMHTGLGVGIIGMAASALHRGGWSYRLMATNPWVVIGVGLAASLGTMYGTFATSPDNYVQKYALWGGFNLCQAAVLSPLLFMQPAVLARAGLYAVAMMGSVAFIGATAKQERYLYIGGPLLAGVAVVVASGFAPLVLPVTAARSLMWTERIWLYGGLAVFGGFTLYDTQKVLHHARLANVGMMKKDIVNESIELELDFINIFVRMVQIAGMRSQK